MSPENSATSSPASHALSDDDRVRLESVLERSRSVGFLGDGPVGDHIEHALGFADALGTLPARFLDLGSGGGVPGLVLCLVWPQAEATLLDAQHKRCVVLHDAIVRLGIEDRATVAQGRAEELGRDPRLRGAFDAVTSRSFGPPAVVAECAAPFLRSGGSVVISEPPDASNRWPAESLAVLGLQPVPSAPASPALASDAPSSAGPDGDQEREIRGHYQVLRQMEPLPERFPRRVGIPAKRPLF